MLNQGRFWQCPPVRHCGLDPQSRGVVTRHAEYLLDTTVAQARTGFKAVSTGWGNNKTKQSHHTVIADLIRNDGEGEVGFDLFTLTFDSSPIKGEGDRWFMSFMFGRGQVMVL